jgi:hypothetical protein
MDTQEDLLAKDWDALIAAASGGTNLVAAAVPRSLVGKVWLSADQARVVWSAPSAKAEVTSTVRLTRSGQLVRDGEVLRERAVLGHSSAAQLPHQVVSVTDVGVLERFARLHLASPESQRREIQAMVKEYGPLGLCSHGRPKGHQPRRVTAEVLDELDRWQDDQDAAIFARELAAWERRCEESAAAGKRRPARPVRTEAERPWRDWQPCSMDRSFTSPEFKPRTKIMSVGSERIEDWIILSQQAAALIKLGAANRRFRAAADWLSQPERSGTLAPLGLPELEEIEVLDPLLPPGTRLDLLVPWTDYTDPAGKRRLINRRSDAPVWKLPEDPDSELILNGGTPRPYSYSPDEEDPEHERAKQRHRAGKEERAEFVPVLPPPGAAPDDDAERSAYEKQVAVSDNERTDEGRTSWGPFPVARVAHDLQAVLDTTLQAWLDQGDLRVQTITDPSTGLVRLRWGNDGLFSAIAIITALTISGVHALAICDYCRQACQPSTWPTVGHHLYCDECGSNPTIRKQMSRYGGPKL